MNDTESTTSWYGPDSATFGDRLAAARQAAGLSQGDVARKLGVKKSTLASWEDDFSEPRANRLSMMAGLLNVSIRWLLTGEGEGPEGPGEEDGADLRSLMAELREVRGQMTASAERLGRLEKRLRVALDSVEE